LLCQQLKASRGQADQLGNQSKGNQLRTAQRLDLGEYDSRRKKLR
jgi:hypothetical protein